METTNKTYEVTIIKKIPFITEFILFLLIPGALILLLAYLFLSSSGQSSNDIQIVAIVKLLPNNLGFVFISLALSSIILIPLYKYLKIYKPANLRFNEQFITIQGEKINLKIPIDTISKIYFKESINFRGNPGGKCIVYIQEKLLTTTTLKLKNYNTAEALIKALSKAAHIRPLIAGANTAFYIDAED